MTSSWFFLSTLNYDARSTKHQIYVVARWRYKIKPNFCSTEISKRLFVNADNYNINHIKHKITLVTRVSFCCFGKFDVHRAVHRNIIPIAKPTRCTNVSNLFYFGMTLYMFQTVFPSIIRSTRLYIQQQILLSAWQMPVAVCTVLNSWWWTERPSEDVDCHSKINKFDKLVHLVGFAIGMLW